MAWIEKRERQKRGAAKTYTVYRVGWRDPSGKTRTRTFDSATDAKRYARDVEHRKDRGDYVDPAAGNITLHDMVGHYLATADLRETTKAKYETLGRLYLSEGIGEMPIRTIGKGDVRTFLADLRVRGKGQPTIEAVSRLLHRVLEVAMEEDRIARIPAHGVHVAPSQPREPRFMTRDEVRKIADEVPDRYRALIWTLAIAGLRIGEASALRVKNVTDTNIRIVESSAEVGGVKVTGPTKSGKSRTVDIAPELRKMLRDHIHTYSNAFDPETYVFTGDQGAQSARTPSARGCSSPRRRAPGSSRCLPSMICGTRLRA